MSDSKGSVDHLSHDHPRHFTTVTLTAEQFESLYLQPKPSNGNWLAGRVGNPTSLGVATFLFAHMPLSMDLLNFQGATAASSTVQLGAFYGCAGVGMWIACIMEWIIGNTFPCVVFGTFAGFWISYGAIIQPTNQIAAAFAPASDASNGITAAAAGAATRGYNAGLGMYFLVWGLIVTIYFIASLRTNAAFAILFFALIFAFELISAAYFRTGQGRTAEAAHLFKVAGGFAMVTALCGIWILFSLLCAAVEMPFTVSLIDLSRFTARKRVAGGKDLEA